MKILLDENLPRGLVAALRAEGHEVESVGTLRMQGLDNGKLYQFANEPSSGQAPRYHGKGLRPDVSGRHPSPQQAAENCAVQIQNFEICFTRDFGFAHNVRQGKVPGNFKLLRVTLGQKSQDEFIKDFVAAFRGADVKNFQHGGDWPVEGPVIRARPAQT